MGAGTKRSSQRRRLSVDGGACPPLRAHIVLNANPLNAFMCLMSHARVYGGGGNPRSLTPHSGQRASFRVLETLDDHMDIIHLFFRPMYLFPSWTAPRDYVLVRYWRFDPDGTYMICLDSVQHPSCPPLPDYVRGELHGVYTIAPRRAEGCGGGGSHRTSRQFDDLRPECLLTSLVQVNPKGWVPTMPVSPLSDQSYAEAFGVSALLQLLDYRDALDHNRFVNVSLNDASVKPRNWSSAVNDLGGLVSATPLSNRPKKLNSDSNVQALHHLAQTRNGGYEEEDDADYDYAYSSHVPLEDRDEGEDGRGGKPPIAPLVPGSRGESSFAATPPPLRRACWLEPDSNSFRVRGKTYKKDRKKFNAGPPVFRLAAVDIVETPVNIYTGMAAHPRERVQQSLARGDLPPFMFVVNIALPGPPCFHMVYYYAVDDVSQIDGTNGTPFSKLAQSFFFGESDEFRDRTFKLIPQIVEGNFLVRKAVGSTPCIMGTKIKQLHLRDPSPNPRYFELLLDTGSDSVAKGVIRLVLGYAKSIVVDMAFLLEGNDESTLPERVMGCLRLRDVEFKNLRFVDTP